MNEDNIIYSIIIPIFNEEQIIKDVITKLHHFLEDNLADKYEIIAVNDGSKDGTKKILQTLALPNFSFISHPYNKGYGAALKSGVHKSQGKYVIFYDGDGQHRPVDLLLLTKEKNNFDMVVGSRLDYNGPFWRRPGKKIINKIANYLVNFNIPDLNSGLRLVRKEYFYKFLHLYPDGFSLSTTITLSFIKHGFNVKYVDIKVYKRSGKSTVKLSDGFKAINLVLRIIMLFSPIKIFLPCSLFFLCLTLVSLYIDIFLYHFNLSEFTLLLFASSMILFLMGLLADQIAAIRRDMKF